jgi:hypothetical protein
MADGSTSTLTNPVTGTGTTNYLPKWTSGTALGNSLVFDNGTNVGIGTTSPTYKFVVSKGGAEGMEFDAGNIIAGRNYLINYNRSTSAYTDFQINANNILFGTSGTERLRITSGGNVGIGTTSPTSRFQSNNASTYNSSTPSGAIIASNLANGNAIIDIGVDSTYLGYIQSRNIADATPYNLLLNPLGGNLGLGVVPSAWTLGPAFQILRSSILAQNNATYISTNAYYGSSAWTYIDNDYASQYYSLSGQHVWRTAPSGTAGGTITFTQAMTLNASGRLLLGTTSDDGSSRLQVSGSIYSLGRTTSFGFKLPDWQIYNTSGGSLAFNNYTTDFLSITSVGNVGIGTTMPAYKLDVNRSSLGTIAQFIANDGTYNPRLLINGTADGLQLFATFSTVADALMFGTGNTEKMRITSGGNVGIGTTSPVFQLDVLGSIPLRLVSNSNATTSTYGASQIFRESNTVGNGVGIAFGMYNSSNANTETGYIGTIITTNTSSSERGDLVFCTTDNGTSRNIRLRIKSNGTINLSNVPTSAVGLSSGDIYSSAGVLMIV